MKAAEIRVLSDADFDESIRQAATPVLVDFWAEWCAPCRRLAPIVDALAEDYRGRLLVAKLNVDENPATTMRFNIRGIPALLLFKDGQVVEQIVGLADKETLKRALDRHLG
ncbi:MAG TPA: thioredoxin [Vicinamibacterales bacterium]|nr:thioredoxin [Vicinamibacterales bacterium]